MNVNNIIFNIMFSFFLQKFHALEECEWINRKGVPCLTITKTPNTSKYTKKLLIK